MLAAYDIALSFVQSLTPTWYRHQQVNFARLLAAVIERPRLMLAELARALPKPAQPLHGKIKRIGRFLDNPRLDELALSARWLKLAYHFGADLPDQPAGERPFLPVLVDTVYFEPFAALLATVPCGSRGLPIALTTYHRTTLEACFAPEASWPSSPLGAWPGPPWRKGHRPSAAVVTPFLSQNLIEQHLLTLLWHLVSPALRAILIADRGFARAALFRWLLASQRDFVVRIDAATHVYLDPAAPSQPVKAALGLRPGERRWCPGVLYGKEDRVPINLLGVWDVGQEEPWYLVTGLARADWTETAYRWRMRTECTHRDEKTGVILREGGDAHALRNVLHLHRLLLVVAAAEWFSALAGLQALHDLPAANGAVAPSEPDNEGQPALPGPADAVGAQPPAAVSEPLAAAAVPLRELASPPASPPPPPSVVDAALPRADLDGPALPPPVVPHRGPRPPLAPWLKRFVARGPLSYVRLGLEVLRADDLDWLLHRMLQWLARFLSLWTPPWRRWQCRYRRLHDCSGFG